MDDPYAAPETETSMPYSARQERGGVSKDERNTGVLIHLLTFAGLIIPLGNILGPLVVWLLKKDESEFIDECGREALNFQISMFLLMLLCIPLVFVIIGIPMLIILVLMDLIMPIFAAIRVSDGVLYRYPLTWRMI